MITREFQMRIAGMVVQQPAGRLLIHPPLKALQFVSKISFEVHQIALIVLILRRDNLQTNVHADRFGQRGRNRLDLGRLGLGIHIDGDPKFDRTGDHLVIFVRAIQGNFVRISATGECCFQFP